MSIWVPPSQQRRELELRREHQQELMEQFETLGTVTEWNELLREVDPYLELVKAGEDAAIPPIRPGYYHLLRHNPTAPPSVEVLEGSDGEFREPGSWVFDLLRESDLWNDQVVRERKRMEAKAEELQRRQRAREREERVEETRDRIKALNPGVSMTSLPSGWRYRARRS